MIEQAKKIFKTSVDNYWLIFSLFLGLAILVYFLIFDRFDI